MSSSFATSDGMLNSLVTMSYNDIASECSPENGCNPNEVVARYLQDNSVDFRRLTETRRKGWASEAGDEFFRRQRQQADNANEGTRNFFYMMMQQIGLDLERSTGCFSVRVPEGTQRRILDMCAAPGGFLKIALDLNVGTSAIGFTLPVSDGGHQLLLPECPSTRITYADITMFAEDMGISNVPEDHPECDKFLPRQLDKDDAFDLVMCDGQVLRTQERAPYRELREARRLTATQLSLGLQHVKSGGSMVILLHKIEAWPAVHLIYRFHGFSTIRLFKPTRAHAKRSSFYLIASNIRTEHPGVQSMVDDLNTSWRISTFGTDDEYKSHLRKDEAIVDEVLHHFGPDLVKLGCDIWRIQETALSRASFNRGV